MGSETPPSDPSTPETRIDLGFAGLSVRPGEHAGHFYEDEELQVECMTAFLARGLETGSKCAYLAPADGGTLEAVLDGLRQRGHDPDEALRDGQLAVTEGLNSVADLKATLREARADAADRFRDLRWAGAMTWAIDRLDDSASLMRWEAACNQVETGGVPVVFYCQYDLREFSGRVVMDALRTHPVCLVGRSVQENALYQEPSDFLAELEERPAETFA